MLRDVSLEIQRGEIHALVGEHGAGKSSLAWITSGLLRPQKGVITCDGNSFPCVSLRKARALGIEIVTQHSPLFDHLSVARNLLVNSRTPRHTFRFDKKNVERRAAGLLTHWGFTLSASAEVRYLSLSDRILLDILRHLHELPRLLILDEALEKLAKENRERLVGLLSEYRALGMSLLYITHHVDDIYQIADRVSILRAGEIILTEHVEGIDKISLIRLAYTRAQAREGAEDTSAEFYHLLKYNQAILEKLPVNLVVTDGQGRVRLINESAASHFSLPHQIPSSLLLADLFPDDSGLLELLQACSAKDRMEVLLSVPIHHGGTLTTNAITTLPIFDESLRIGTIILIDDVTEREQMREQIILSEKLASMGLLAAGVAHEINNPLEIMSNCVDFLKTPISALERARALRDIEEEITTISRIVRSFLSFTGDGRTEHEQFNVQELVSETLRFVQREARRRGVVIHPPVPAPAEVVASPADLRQVLLNILRNSFEAMYAGGEIFIRVDDIFHPDRPYVEISVSDSGPGISAVNVTDIFLPFFSTKKSNGKNYGLGLFTSYSLVQKNGGTISAENLPEGGCRFLLRFPRR